MAEVAIAAFAAIVLAAMGLGRHLTVRVGQMHATVQGIDRAVNHRAPGEPTLAEQVDQIAADVADIGERMTACEHKLCEIAGEPQ